MTKLNAYLKEEKKCMHVYLLFLEGYRLISTCSPRFICACYACCFFLS